MSDDSVFIPETYDGPTFDEAQEGGFEDAPNFPTEDSAPAESGQGEETVTTDDTQAPSRFDLDKFGNEIVTIKVDGEEIDVPVAELRNGYMRQAAFTQKTQALSFANDLAQSLESDPQGTLAYLQWRFGGGQQAVQQQPEEQWPEDPTERELAQLRSYVDEQLEPLRVQAAKDHTLRVLGSLEQTYGEDFNRTEVIQEAVRRGVNDPAQFEAIYQQLAFTRMRAAQLAQQDKAAQVAAENAKREQAKGGIVNHSNGSSPQTSAQPTSIKTFDDAARAAAASLGIEL